MTDSDYISLTTEIFQGYTELTLNGRSVYLRHITLADQNILSRNLNFHTEENISRGIVSEKERLEQLKADGDWTDDDELSMAEMESYINNLHLSKKKYALISQQKEAQKIIDEETAKLNELKNKKLNLIGRTAEDFAARKANEEFIRHLLYKDQALTQFAFSVEQFGELDYQTLGVLYEEYQRMMRRFGDDNIQKAVLQDFFSLYLPFCEKPFDFYGRPVVQMTIFQQKLLAWGRCFSSIFQNVDKIPDSIRKDPQALLDFADRSRNKDKLSNSGKNKEGSTSFVMGTREDAESMAGDGVEVGDLAEELKKNNGFLSQSQLMQKMGIKMD